MMERGKMEWGVGNDGEGDDRVGRGGLVQGLRLCTPGSWPVVWQEVGDMDVVLCGGVVWRGLVMRLWWASAGLPHLGAMLSRT